MKNDVPTADIYPCATDDSMFIIAAFRYALGRRTYAVECISTVLARLAPKMRTEDRDLIVREIEEALAKGNAGDACDIESWKKLRNFLISLGNIATKEKK